MSASEKLRALPVRSYSVSRDGFVVMDVRPEAWTQIVAVVEAAEKEGQWARLSLRRALAALDEALP